MKQLHFNGITYEAKFDYDRLKGQNRRVFNVMKDGRYRTLDEIHAVTGDPTHSISARLRDFRKERFGCHEVNRRSAWATVFGALGVSVGGGHALSCPWPARPLDDGPVCFGLVTASTSPDQIVDRVAPTSS